MILVESILLNLNGVVIDKQGKIPAGTLISIRAFSDTTISGVIIGFDGITNALQPKERRLELKKLVGKKIAVPRKKVGVHPGSVYKTPLEKYVTLTAPEVKGSIALNIKDGHLYISPQIMSLLTLEKESKIMLFHNSKYMYITRCENNLSTSFGFEVMDSGAIRFNKDSTKAIVNSLQDFHGEDMGELRVLKTPFPTKLNKFSYTIAYKISNSHNMKKEFTKKLTMDEIHQAMNARAHDFQEVNRRVVRRNDQGDVVAAEETI